MREKIDELQEKIKNCIISVFSKNHQGGGSFFFITKFVNRCIIQWFVLKMLFKFVDYFIKFL